MKRLSDHVIRTEVKKRVKEDKF